MKKGSCPKSLDRNIRSSVLSSGSFVWLSLTLLLCGSPALAQSQQPSPETESSAGRQPDQQSSGTISGTVVDPSGAAVAGARLSLTRENQSPSQKALSGDDGQFSFAGIAPGPFMLTITAERFATQTFSATLHPGESYAVPQIALALAPETTDVRVVLTQAQEAQAQVKEQEKQRALGFVPNFFVSYVPTALPLTSKQKFELAVRMTVDPVTFALTGVTAGIEQAQNDFSGYGQGAQGYGKRYGAAYADIVTDTFIGSAILPSLLKQDPRYFYKGSGGARRRILYALANSVICKGDDGRWQANYSNIIGTFAAGGISNLYYPAANRNGPGLTLANGLIGIGESATVNLLQEFLIRKVTPNIPNHDKAKS
jgi:hypothetical protein